MIRKVGAFNEGLTLSQHFRSISGLFINSVLLKLCGAQEEILERDPYIRQRVEHAERIWKRKWLVIVFFFYSFGDERNEFRRKSAFW